ncbi:MAG TPA: hypothetical protein VH436_33480 [Vicinamibacterales bacterium]
MARLVTALLVMLLAAPLRAGADAQINEWIGNYTMSHDGLQGTLRIGDSRADCAAPAWCRLTASYIDSNGMPLRATIRVMDQAWQHMVLYIAFPNNMQRFDAYLMSWDKNRIAGTTMWQGRTFGFYAFKRPAVDAAAVLTGRRGRSDLPPLVSDGGRGGTAAPTSRRTVNANGEVETVLPDGSRRLTKPGQCGWRVIRPDGTASIVSCNQVPSATPPFPDNVTATWLDAHGMSLLDIIRALLGNDQTSVDNYLRNNETSTMGLYDRIRTRASMISALTL